MGKLLKRNLKKFMKKFEFLEHTADIKMKVLGKTKEELFQNALIGMQVALQPKIQNKKSKVKAIVVKSVDLSALLVDFLSEALYLIQVNQEIYNVIKFEKFSDREIRVDLFGQKVERFGEDIKAVTYNNLEICQNKDKILEAIILFDV